MEVKSLADRTLGLSLKSPSGWVTSQYVLITRVHYIEFNERMFYDI